MRFRIEDLVLPSQLQVAKLFECPICLEVLHDPVQTKCEHHFCSDCIRKVRNGVCPMCKTANDEDDMKPMKDVNLSMHRMMGKIPVICPYRCTKPSESSASSAAIGSQSSVQSAEPSAKRPRKELSCDWSGSYADLLEVHIGACLFKPVECPHCHLSFQRQNLESHVKLCEHRFEACPICSNRMRNKDEHMREYAQTHVTILQSQLKEAEQRHSGEATIVTALSDLSAQMARLHAEVYKCAKTTHVTQKIAELKAGLCAGCPQIGESFEFIIGGVQNLLRLQHGQAWRSPVEAWMPFVIDIYPHGVEGSDDRSCTVFVKAVGGMTHESIRFVADVQIGSHSLEIDDIETANMTGKRFRNDLRSSAEGDSLTVRLTVKAISRKAKFQAQ